MGGQGVGRPLVLGAGGRMGRLLRRLADDGRWPGPAPLWHERRPGPGPMGWDLAAGPPAGLDLSEARGIVVLAGATAGDAAALAANARAALAALDLARGRVAGPVLLMSSAAVYGRGAEPHAEDREPAPESPYGAAKRAMEAAVAGDLAQRPGPAACGLRLGNVAGADMLFGAAAAGRVTLDRLSDGSSPRRAYVGPLTLARALVALLARDDLPPVLNLAQPGLVAMADVLAAAGLDWDWRPAPPAALPALEMDLSRLQALAPLPPATPESLVAEARLAGWAPAP